MEGGRGSPSRPRIALPLQLIERIPETQPNREFPHNTVITWVDNGYKSFMLLFRARAHIETCRDMRKDGGRDKRDSPVHQGAPHGKFHNALSSSELDATDLRMLTLAGNRPMTVLSMAEGTDISFVHCLRRTKRLQGMDLLERIEDVSNGGLYRYLSRNRHL